MSNPYHNYNYNYNGYNGYNPQSQYSSPYSSTSGYSPDQQQTHMASGYQQPQSSGGQESYAQNQPSSGYPLQHVEYTKSPVLCLWPKCNGSFTRTADLARHYRTVHNFELIDCPYPRCSRKGDDGFARKDHLAEHRRKYHMEGQR